MFTRMAAPPKRAATPTAPVLIGTPGLLVDEALPPEVAAGKVVVGVVMPLVNGIPVPVEPPLKAGGTVVAVGLGVSVVLAELRTLEKRC